MSCVTCFRVARFCESHPDSRLFCSFNCQFIAGPPDTKKTKTLDWNWSDFLSAWSKNPNDLDYHNKMENLLNSPLMSGKKVLPYQRLLIYTGPDLTTLMPNQFEDEKVVSAACSDNFIVFATESGKLYTSTAFNQVDVPNNEKAKLVYCTDTNVMFITTSGNIYKFKIGETPSKIVLSKNKEFYVQGAMNRDGVFALTSGGRVLGERILNRDLISLTLSSESSRYVDIKINEYFLMVTDERGYTAFYITAQRKFKEYMLNELPVIPVHPKDILITSDGQDMFLSGETFISMQTVEEATFNFQPVGENTKYIYVDDQREIRLTKDGHLLVNNLPFDNRVSDISIGKNIAAVITDSPNRIDLIQQHVRGKGNANLWDTLFMYVLKYKYESNCVEFPMKREPSFVTFPDPFDLEKSISLFNSQSGVFLIFKNLNADNVFLNLHTGTEPVELWTDEKINAPTISAGEEQIYFMIPQTFLHYTKECIRQGQRYILLPITFFGVSYGVWGSRRGYFCHHSMVIYDTLTKTLERFDSDFGEGFDKAYKSKFLPNRSYEYYENFLVSKLESAFKKAGIPVIKVIAAYEECPKLGPQTLVDYDPKLSPLWRKTKGSLIDGYCSYWKYWYANLRLLYPNKSKDDILKMFKSNEEYARSIEDFVAYVALLCNTKSREEFTALLQFQPWEVFGSLKQ